MAPMVTFIVYLFYAIPSLILYILTLKIINQNKSIFGSSFFQLYRYDCFVNFLTFFKVFTTLRVPEITCHNCPLAPFFLSCNDYLPMSFIFSTGYQMAFLQYGMTTIISLNRITVLLKFKFFEPLWKKFSWFLVLLLMILPFLSTRVALNYDAQFSYMNSSDYFLLTSTMPVWEIYSALIPFMVITIFISLVANFSGFLIVRKWRLVKANKAESTFLKITSLTLVVQVIGTFLSIGMLVFENSEYLFYLSVIRPFVSDGLTLVQPWLLYLFSSAIRKKIKEMFRSAAATFSVPSGIFRN